MFKNDFHREHRRAFRLSLRPVLFLLFACIASACTSKNPTDLSEVEPQIAPVFIVNYRIDYGDRLIVPVYVNDEGPFDFIVDTAATRSAAFENLLEKLSFPPSQTIQNRVFGLSGVEMRPVVKFKKIEFGDFAEYSFPAVAFDDWEYRERTPHGVIGLDILSKYFVVFVPSEQRMEFYAPTKTPQLSSRDWQSTALIPNQLISSVPDLYLIKASLSSVLAAPVEFPLLIDTGSTTTVGNPALINSLNTVPPFEELYPDRHQINDVYDTNADVVELTIGELSADKIRWRPRSIFVTDARIFREIDYADIPLVIAGYDLLGTRPFALDFKNERFFVKTTP